MGTADYLRRQRATASPADVVNHPERLPTLGRLAVGMGMPTNILPWDHRNAIDHNQGVPYLAALKNAENVGSATVNVYDASYSREQESGNRKPPGFAVRKAFETDDQAGEQARLKACPDHPVARLLQEPNPIDDQNQFLKKAAIQQQLTGGCLIWDPRNAANEPINLYVLPRPWWQYQRPTHEHPIGYYRVTNYLGAMYGGWPAGLGNTFNIDRRNVIQFGDPHAMYIGEYYSRMTACAEELDVYFATIRKIASGLRNGVKPGLAFKAADGANLSEEQIRVWQAHIESEFMGVDNAGRTILTGAFEPVPLQPAEDGSTETRMQNQEMAQMIFGTPSAVFGALKDGTYSGTAAVMKAYTAATLNPICKMIAGALTRRYRSLYGRDYRVEIKPADYDDPEMSLKRAGMLVDMAKSGGASWNEARVVVGLPPRPELDEIQKPEASEGGAPGGEDGGLDLGADAAGDMGAPDDPAGDFDLGVGDLGDDDGPGWADKSQAGRPKPSFGRQSLNGTGAH